MGPWSTHVTAHEKTRLIGNFWENEVLNLTELINMKTAGEKNQKTELHYLKHIWFDCNLTNLIQAQNKTKT